MKYQIKETEKQAAFTLKKALAYAYDILTAAIMDAGYGPGTAETLGTVLTRAIQRIDADVIEEEDYDVLMDAASVYHRRCMDVAKKSGILDDVRAERTAYGASMELLRMALSKIGGEI